MVDPVLLVVTASVKLDILDQIVHHVINKKSNFYNLKWNHLIIDIGCNAGDCLTCANGGNCLLNGTCDCKFGFTGEQCATCKVYFFRWTSINIKIILILFGLQILDV